VNQNANIAAVAIAAEELRKRDLIIFMLLLQLIQSRELSVRSPPGCSQAVRLPAWEYRCNICEEWAFTEEPSPLLPVPSVMMMPCD
jgi:hypothetical protein